MVVFFLFFCLVYGQNKYTTRIGWLLLLTTPSRHDVIVVSHSETSCGKLCPSWCIVSCTVITKCFVKVIFNTGKCNWTSSSSRKNCFSTNNAPRFVVCGNFMLTKLNVARFLLFLGNFFYCFFFIHDQRGTQKQAGRLDGWLLPSSEVCCHQSTSFSKPTTLQSISQSGSLSITHSWWLLAPLHSVCFDHGEELGFFAFAFDGNFCIFS